MASSIHESLSVASLPSMYEWWTGLEWNGGLCLEKVNNEKTKTTAAYLGENILQRLHVASILLISLADLLPSTWCGLSNASAVLTGRVINYFIC